MDALRHYLADPIAMILAALGLNFLSASEFFGAMALAAMAASVARHINRERDQRDILTVILMACGFAVGALLMLHMFNPNWPPHPVALVAGFLAHFVGRLFAKVSARIEDNSDGIVDRVIDRVIGGRKG